MAALLSVQRFVLSPKYAPYLCLLLLLGDALLCALIIRYVPYTEIDWTTYMQQVSRFKAGQYDYLKLYGDTGPLVYPAAHVYIYSTLHSLTDGGVDIRTAQWVFAGVYLATLSVTMKSYHLAGAPLYIYPMLVLSKRLHSIYVLRLFNDCWAMLFFSLAVLAYQKKSRLLASMICSLGLGTKMNLLLAVPGVAVLLLQDVGFTEACGDLFNIGLIQVLLATPFLRANYQSYLSRAFDFSRVFLYKWTVNWTFLGEDVFLSKPFAASLLAVHAALLLLFINLRWLRPSGKTLLDLPSLLFASRTPAYQHQISSKITPKFIALTLYTSNLIGILCARSLHYQFFSWLAWSTPFLLWQTGIAPQFQIIVWALQEYAWNVYPSTSQSSVVIIVCLVTILYGLLVHLGIEEPVGEVPRADRAVNTDGTAEKRVRHEQQARERAR